jgi:hypothetical protein
MYRLMEKRMARGKVPSGPGGAVARVAPDATAYAHRGAPFVANILGTSPDAAGAPACEAWARACAARLAPVTAPGAYVSFLDRDEAARVPDAYGPANLARLRALKSRLDPDNFFRLNANVAPRY